jgi:hypothetical protein
MIRFACSGALACATVALAASSASAAAGPVITSGTLTDPSGNPTFGTVRVYPFPHVSGRAVLPVLGQAHTGPDGRFAVRASDERLLERFARQRDGYLSFTAVAETAGHRHESTFTGFVARTRDGLRVVDSAATTRRAGVARIASADAPAPRLTITARVPRPTFAYASQQGQCKNERQVRVTGRSRRSTVVGELNNAYNDGTWGRFTYGRQRYADSWIGVAWDPPDVGDVTVAPIIEDEEHITDSGRATFPAARRRWSRRLRSTFEYVRLAVRNNTCAAWDVYVRPESWIGDTDSSIKQRGALNRCDPNAFRGGFEGGSGFWRATSEAVRWTRGVNAFGIKLTSRSGFSENVTLAYRFGGPIRKGHYLCGPDGRQSPYQAGRVFSGALRR